MQVMLRTMDTDYNNLTAGEYACWDDLDRILDRGTDKCNRVGLWKSGTYNVDSYVGYINYLLESDTPEV